MSDFEKLINASDLIDWIIETDPEWCIGTVRSIVDHIEDMPSAQSKIIRCEDCKYSSPNHVYGCRLEPFDTNEKGGRMYSDDYCSKAILRGE